MPDKIAVQVVTCLKTFQSLVSDFSNDTSGGQPAPQLWQDALARFRIWSSNIAAHQKGQSSLDYRLRDASHIKEQILKVLASLRQNLLDAEEVLVEIECDGSNESSASELEEIYLGTQKLLECLFQLSMRIRRPAQRDKLLGRRKEGSKDFEDFDRRHVRDKFPRAPDSIVDRLASAILKRRSTLSYFERHRRKLTKGIALPHESQLVDSRTEYSSTMATTLQDYQQIVIETRSNSHASETSYAPSLFSGDSRITIPPAPLESANGRPFECPYCFFIIIVDNPRDWAKHLFQDLEPYVCVFEDCEMPGRMYNNKGEWLAHLRECHPLSLSDTRCSLCAETPLTDLQVQQHLRRHLEDLALFILPQSGITEQDDDLGSVDSDSGMEGFDAHKGHESERRFSFNLFCHECSHGWFDAQGGLICPNCESEFVEPIPEGSDVGYIGEVTRSWSKTENVAERSETAKSQAQTTNRPFEQVPLPHLQSTIAGLGYETWERQAKDRKKGGGLRRVGAWMGLVKQKSKTPDTPVFKGDLDDVRIRYEREQLESEPKADIVRDMVAQWANPRDSESRRRMGAEEAQQRREERTQDYRRPLAKNKIVE